MASCLTLALASSATANPSGPTVRHGQVQITPGAQAQIQQLTDRAIVDWQSFSIGTGESVQFLQPGQLSVILNRVTGVDPSQILGSLSANGQVFLINPNGILFGPNSTVNVGGLVASTLNISNEDFLSGNYSFFTEEGQDLAAVVNQGTIRITDGGYAVLTGPSVINEGTIVARTGNVVLASGEQATLNLDGRDLVHFALVGKVSDGTVLLAPGVMSESLAQTFGIRPELRADKLVQMPDGSVRMVNSSGTTVQNGLVSVDGRSGENAGNVLLDSGDVTIVGQGSRTTADGIGADSDGGDILVLSSMDASATTRGFTDVQAGSLLSARGGDSGDGGFIEVSGDGINLHGDFTVAAENGRAGDFLLDPVLVTIVDGDNAPTTVTNPLTLSSNTIIGDAWFESASFSGFSSFTLESTGDILFDLGTQGTNPTGDLAINFRGGAGSVALTLTAGTDAVEIGGIDFGDDGISLTGLSSLNLEANGEIALGDATFDIDGPLRINTTDGANVSLGSAQIDLDSNSGTNPVNIFADGDLDLGTSFLDIREFGHSAAMQIEAGGNIDLGSASVVITSEDPGGTVDVVSTTVRAGGNIFSDPADGVAGTFTNTFTAAGSTLFEAGGSINLPDLNL
ncbi:MAG: filamentous hemagglutinin N-terminal domain-containing protein, partial [Candidatus Eremiobacteraeota bacterium]|nr:filamentous hemagglutinin N-terminal domain-containing protein [Candidatus Eremiobacteraeota bacterium]